MKQHRGLTRPSAWTLTRASAMATTVGAAFWAVAAFMTGVGFADEIPAATTSTTAATAPNGRGAIIPVSDEISDVTTESIKRRVAGALEEGAGVIVFEINTPGGYVTSALEISNYIKNLENVKTIAWVNTDAYSAGSMIAVACDEIVMAKSSTLGDCGVIMGGPTGPEEVPEGIRAKAESPVLEQFRDSAAKHGYDRLLCEAMVVKEHEVYWIEHVETGERKFVETGEKDRLLETDRKTSVFGLEVTAPSSKEPEWRLVKTAHDPVSDSEMAVDQPIDKATELLTMSQSRAFAFGFCKGIVSSEKDLAARYGLSLPIPRIEFTALEVFTRWLTSMPVRAFLMIIVMLGVYVEFNTPGLGAAGLVALIALGIFLGAPFLTGLANVWEIVIIALGLILIGVELFVLPGFGVAGISGIVLLLVGLLATFVPEEPGRFPIYWPSMEAGVEGLKRGVQTLGAALVLSIVGIVALSRYLPRIPYVNAIVPANPTPSEVMPSDPYDGLARVGDVGRTIGALRPAGKAKFGTMLVDVVSQGQLLDEGTQVEVIERMGNRVVVRPARSA
ncbi:MAG: hypothetical protein HOP29_13520 [Phycisphaerales bacterium]|nr:hypothetical protein [Phycisphaerales bacterium]